MQPSFQLPLVQSLFTPWVSRLLLLALGVLLSGCATVSTVKPGTAVADVIRQYGRPSVVCPLAEGARRMIWSQQPQGETAYALRVGADGRVGSPESLLNDAHFSILNNGEIWTREKIHCEFGTPANVSRDGFGSDRQWVWGYRYMQTQSYPAMMYIYLGVDGARMTRFESLPDPDRNEEVMGGRR